jgi:hypothetical protein
MSWIEEVWAARAKGWLTSEEAWEVILQARDAPDPLAVVDRVLHGLAAAYRPPPDAPVLAPDELVIEDLPGEPA